MEPIQPIVPEGTPLPTPPVGVPPFPITPFAVWTWSSPVIPDFYWNVYSAEQRIKQICKEIGRIEAYLQYLVDQTNKNLIEIEDQISKLTDRIAALEKHVEEEVARLDALIAKLREDLEQEIHDREDADTALGDRIDQEILDRTHGDDTLHQEISKETQDRIHADDQLHKEISAETQAREDADTALETRLTAAIAQRLLPTDVTAGAEIEITRPDPSSNRIVIASTVSHSISELETEISGLQAALEAEVSERRADDAKLWAAVNQRIERGKILAGPGIRVDNDPDSSTVTISATGGGTGGGSTTIEAGDGIKVEAEGETTTVSLATPYPSVEGTAPVTVTATSSTVPGAGSTGMTYRVGVSAATESEAGIISEARVKELAGTVAPSLSAEAPLKIEEGKISLTKDPAGPVTSSAAGLSVREITPETSSESEAGVVSKETIKTLATFSGGVNESYGLTSQYSGGIRVKASTDVFGFTADGELALSRSHVRSDEFERKLPAKYVIDRSGKPESVTDFSMAGTMDHLPKFWLVNADFMVKESSSSQWKAATPGTFEAFVSAGNTDGHLYYRCTPYGATYYAGSDSSDKDSWSIVAVKIIYTVLGLPIEASAE